MTELTITEHALDGQQPPAEPPGLCAGEVVRLAVGADVARLLGHDAIARVGHDPEGVHQARVAARRLRSHLTTFAPVLRQQPVAKLERDLRWISRPLGAVRDADVLRLRLTKAIRAFDPRDRDEAFELLARLDADQAGSRGVLVRSLRSGRYERLVRALGGFVAAPPFRRSAGLPAAPFLIDVVYDRFAQLESSVRSLPSLPSDEDLHQVRITAKPLRYAAEAGSHVLGEHCARLARRATDLCDELGRLNDGAKAIEWLERVGGSDGRITSLTRLRSGEVAAMAESRSAFGRRWSRVRDAAGGLSWPVEGTVDES